MSLDETECASCGIAFAVPTHWLATRKRDGKSFYCPNGHSLSYGASEADRLRTELSRAKQEQERLAQAAADERERAAKAERATARLRNRIQGGACPDCNRTFANLRRHMHTKHGVKGEADAAAHPRPRPRLVSDAG